MNIVIDTLWNIPGYDTGNTASVNKSGHVVCKESKATEESTGVEEKRNVSLPEMNATVKYTKLQTKND